MMEIITNILQIIQAMTPYGISAIVGGLFFIAFLLKILIPSSKKSNSELPPVPEVPGLPVVGNLFQLKEKKPYKTFLKWAETYGPIYSIRTGAKTLVILNNADVAREAMVTRYSSISRRKLSKALFVLTENKCMVAASDDNEFYKLTKRCMLENVTGPNAQRKHRCNRDALVENITSRFHEHVTKFPHQAVNFREIFESELFSLAFKQALGTDVQSIYVEDLGTTLSREDMFNVLVLDPMEGGIQVDWRDFFPYLRWLPNKAFEEKIQRIYSHRQYLLHALINEQMKRIASGKEANCLLDFLLSEVDGKLTKKQIVMLIWEGIIGASENTLVTTEWAMFELSKNQKCQEKLFEEIRSVCGSEAIKEENLPYLPYLHAVLHETLRKYNPASLLPLRYAHEDTQLGGYHVPAGTDILVNVYACNMDKNVWENPEEWKPERFVDRKFDLVDLKKTMAFGAGKRTCIGALQATSIACTSIGRLVQEFEWRLKGGEVEKVNTARVSSRKLHPLNVNIKQRNVM